MTPGINPVSPGQSVVSDQPTVGGQSNPEPVAKATNGALVASGHMVTLIDPVPGSETVVPKNAPMTVTEAEPSSTNTTLSVSVADGAQNAPSQVVISQVYGGGANAGPPVGIYEEERGRRAPRTAAKIMILVDCPHRNPRLAIQKGLRRPERERSLRIPPRLTATLPPTPRRVGEKEGRSRRSLSLDSRPRHAPPARRAAMVGILASCPSHRFFATHT